MEMRTNKFMIYVFSAIMLGGMVACSSDDPETDTGNGNGNGGNAEAPYVWGTEGAIKTCDHLLFNDDKTENAKGTVIGNGDQEFIFKGTQTLSKGTYLMKGWIYVGTAPRLFSNSKPASLPADVNCSSSSKAPSLFSKSVSKRFSPFTVKSSSFLESFREGVCKGFKGV